MKTSLPNRFAVTIVSLWYDAAPRIFKVGAIGRVVIFVDPQL